MRYTKERLYSLLPAIYRTHDAKLGNPLKAFIDIIAEEVEILENDVENLYDNWFIETCDEWVIPYIGDLVAAEIPFSTRKETSSTSSSSFSNDVANDMGISQRPWVANTLGYRRRKGTVAVLEQLASDITGWKSRAVEFFRLTNTTQNFNRHPSQSNSNLDLREATSLNQILTPFDSISHSIDVRGIGQGRGYHNVSNVGIFLWRIQAYPVLNSPGYDHKEGRYSFNQLGIDAPLFNHPVTEKDISHLAQEINLPTIITRSTLRSDIERYYGKEKSIFIETNSFPLSTNDVVVEDLSDWQRPPSGKLAAIDPLLGRITFPLNRLPESVRVSYYYGFSADMGGGFYDRDRERSRDNTIASATTSSASTADIKVYKISKLITGTGITSSISSAVSQWSSDNRPSAIFEIIDSEFYEEKLIQLALPSNCKLVIRSANGQRPILRAPLTKQEHASKEGGASIEILGDRRSAIILDGLVLDKSLRLEIKPGELEQLMISHCTMVPAPNPSIKVDEETGSLEVNVSHSICGKIESIKSEARFKISNCIVDGKPTEVIPGEKKEHPKKTDAPGVIVDKAEGTPKLIAIRCFRLDIESSTIFGSVEVEMINASNAIFTGRVTAIRRQWGCVRFSYTPKDSVIPRCFECLPERNGRTDSRSILRASPYTWFTSDRYGDPAYGQLHKNVDARIFEGADNRSEMGAFNKLYQAQRILNIKSALDEYLRFGIEAGIIVIDLSEKNHESRYY